jgi:tetratricopeptide (TPR) repeat protein
VRKRLATIVVVGLTMALVLAAGRASAQSEAEASTTNPHVGTDLAQRSLELLRRGEDSYDPAAKAEFYRQGLDLAKQAVAADDNNADAHFALFANMGRVMLADGATPNPLNLLRVNRELDRTLELDPHHSDALAAKGGLCRQLPRLLGGSLSKAERYLQEAIANDPDAVGARIELARTYKDMGKAAQGVEPLRVAMSIAERQGKTRQLYEARELLKNIEQDQ